jgi:hypothetical protein
MSIGQQRSKVNFSSYSISAQQRIQLIQTYLIQKSTEKDWIAGQANIYPLLLQGYSNNRVYNYYTIKER